jgi:hypothetical protein
MSVDPIVARAQQAFGAAIETAVKEAYAAGRGDSALDLKTRILGLIEDVFATHEPKPPAEPAPAEHNSEGGHYEGQPNGYHQQSQQRTY